MRTCAIPGVGHEHVGAQRPVPPPAPLYDSSCWTTLTYIIDSAGAETSLSHWKHQKKKQQKQQARK
eukprot:10479084-Prorocentrum_lima.AAC.1